MGFGGHKITCTPVMSQYSHGRTSLLAVQIDAAINSGNSGGPVVQVIAAILMTRPLTRIQ